MNLPQYPKLPHMKCDAGCGQCCGPVFCTRAEADAIVSYANKHGIVPLGQGVTCPLYINGVCSVYEVRPMLCRLFGHTPKMVCANGHNVNASLKRTDRAMAEYVSTFGPDVCLHSVVYSEDETLDIIRRAAPGVE